MDIGRSFSYVTEDPDWLKKIVIGALLSLVIVGTPAVMGWMIEVVRRVSNNDPTPLPDWDNLGDYFITGLKLLLITLVWQLPVFLLIGCGLGAYFTFLGQMSEQSAALTISIGSVCLGLFVAAYVIFVTILTAPLLGQMADGVKWTSLFNPRSSFNMLKGNLGGYLLTMLVGLVISNVLSWIGTIACGVGYFFGLSYGVAVMAHLIGQAHAQSKTAIV